MKHMIFKNLSILALGIVLAVGAQYAHATLGSPSMPSNFSAGNNTLLPINVGFTSQSKGTGDLGGLSVKEFLVLMSAQMQKSVFFEGVVRGHQVTPGATSTVRFGLTQFDVDAVITGGVATRLQMQSTGPDSNLVHSGPELRKVCAEAGTGILILCAQ